MTSPAQKKNNPLGSMLPMLLLGLITIFFLQYFGGSNSKSPSEEKSEKKTVTTKTSPASKRFSTDNKNDFRFQKGRGNSLSIDTGNFLVHLSSRGGRIEALYVKSGPRLPLPKEVITASQDPIGIQHKALEITLGNGMDFQPHIYYSGEYADQLGQPPLNQAAFQLKRQQHQEDLGIHEVYYTLPLRFARHRLELRKIYRFYDKENYFRQITILRNLERRELNFLFELDGKKVYGALFYKPFGDLGPTLKESSTAIGGSGKFFYYNAKFNQRSNTRQGEGGGCGFLLGCTSLDKAGLYSNHTESLDSLVFMGTSSRYFFAYTEFLTVPGNGLHSPDGFLYKNETDMSGKEAMTAVFLDFRLGPRQKGDLDLSEPGALLDQEGKLKGKEEGNRRHLALLQKERRDALIIDNKVFVGARSSNSHTFQRPELIQAAFGVEAPNPQAAEAIHVSGYTAFFSGISDAIIVTMRWLHQFIGNYGWCIITIALGFKLLTFPLNQMQVNSMQRMSALRPEMDALNKQYADNPQERQKRTMQLFKKHKVNPAKGCLPVLIQMPIFVGLYSAFSSSIELWHSPFILWMTDLSRPDTVWVIPYIDINLNILPLLMAGSQILYQRFTTVATDPQQKMLMYFMPLIMLLFFWKIPSGVTLYWTVQNFISIAWQQASKLIGKGKKAVS